MKTDHPYFLETTRIVFRRWANEDLPLALALWGDVEVTRLIGDPLSYSQVQERLRQEIATSSEHHVPNSPFCTGICHACTVKSHEKRMQRAVHLWYPT